MSISSIVFIYIYIYNNNTINPRTIIIYTDSRVSLDSLFNPKNHTFLVEKIREKVATLEKKEWKIKFSWVKAHAGNYGNETADRPAEEAARSHTTNYEYNRIPISAIKYEAAEEAIKKWQTEWTTTHKAMATKQYYPTVRDRLRSKIKLTPKITAVLTGHRKTKAYLCRFHLSEEATCSCGHEDQTMDHILFHCANTSAQCEVLIQQLRKWPTTKQDLIVKYQKQFETLQQSVQQP
jgi:hypothetical protein